MGKRWDENRRWVEAQRKAHKQNKKAYDEAPLFADQIPKVTAEEEYWRSRFMVAHAHENGGEKIMDRDRQGMRLRYLASQLLPPEVFQMMDSQNAAHLRGDILLCFWAERLTTTNRIILTWCHRVYLGPFPVIRADGSLMHWLKERVRCEVDKAWPPDGWVPPLTREELEKILEIPRPLDHPAGVELDKELQKFTEALCQKA